MLIKGGMVYGCLGVWLLWGQVYGGLVVGYMAALSMRGMVGSRTGSRGVYIWVPGTMLDHWGTHVHVHLDT